MGRYLPPGIPPEIPQLKDQPQLRILHLPNEARDLPKLRCQLLSGAPELFLQRRGLPISLFRQKCGQPPVFLHLLPQETYIT